MPKADFEIRYDRRVSDEFLKEFLRNGAAARLRQIAAGAALPLDLQMRKDSKTGSEWATLYAGLTGVLNVHYSAQRLRLKAHPTWMARGSKGFGFEEAWTVWTPSASVDWDAVELYLERVIPKAVRDHGMTEGAVQSVASKSTSKEWAILDREVTPSFRDTTTKKSILAECMEPLVKAVAKADVPHKTRPLKFGSECDILALDREGRVLAIEVKPARSAGIAWVAAQAAMYARVLKHWVDHDEETESFPGPAAVLEGMLTQRQALGHAKGFSADLPTDLQVVPVVVLQRGAEQSQLDYMHRVRDALTRTDTDVPPVEIYEVSILGDFTRLI